MYSGFELLIFSTISTKNDCKKYLKLVINVSLKKGPEPGACSWRLKPNLKNRSKISK
jgi:hypothetical protein